MLASGRRWEARVALSHNASPRRIDLRIREVPTISKMHFFVFWLLPFFKFGPGTGALGLDFGLWTLDFGFWDLDFGRSNYLISFGTISNCLRSCGKLFELLKNFRKVNRITLEV